MAQAGSFRSGSDDSLPLALGWQNAMGRSFPWTWRLLKRRDGLGNLCEATAAIA